MKKNTILLALSLLSTLSIAKAENIKFQNIRAGGTGCPSDITQIVTAPDLSSASIIFQTFESHVPNIVNNPKASPLISILNCNIFLDLQLPIGQKLDSLEISYDMRGHTYLEPGVSGNFKSYLISANGMGTERTQGVQLIQEKNWMSANSSQDEDFTINAIKSFSLNSQCNSGRQTNLVSVHLQHQLGSQITQGHERSNASGTITMDSSDLKGGIKFKANISACRAAPNTPPPPGRNCRVIRVEGRSQMQCQ